MSVSAQNSRATPAPSGLYHLQGYLVLKKKLRLAQTAAIDGFERAHLEVARGTPQEASEYCKKDGDFDEFGSLPPPPGPKVSAFEALREWVKEQPTPPTMRCVWETFPSLAGRYRSAILECIEIFGNKPELVSGELREWQQELDSSVQGSACDRRITFVVDEEGNKGKSWLTSHWLTEYDGAQFMSVGKRDDLAFSVKVESKLFVFDVPRGSMEFLQYGILEQLKNRVVFSPKYMSVTKILHQVPHVVVFCNEHPDMTKLSEDRYNIIEI